MSSRNLAGMTERRFERFMVTTAGLVCFFIFFLRKVGFATGCSTAGCSTAGSSSCGGSSNSLKFGSKSCSKSPTSTVTVSAGGAPTVAGGATCGTFGSTFLTNFWGTNWKKKKIFVFIFYFFDPNLILFVMVNCSDGVYTVKCQRQTFEVPTVS